MPYPEIRGLDDFFIRVAVPGGDATRCLSDCPWEVVEAHFRDTAPEYMLQGMRALHGSLRALGDHCDAEGVLTLTEDMMVATNSGAAATRE